MKKKEKVDQQSETVQLLNVETLKKEMLTHQATEGAHTVVECQDKPKGKKKQHVPRISSCKNCNTKGLYLESCIECGTMLTSYDKREQRDGDNKFDDLGKCHLCKKGNWFATRCACGRYCLLPIKKEDQIIGKRKTV